MNSKPGDCCVVYSREDEIAAHEQMDAEMWGNDRSSCGGWTYDPPCGGCYSCVHGQLSHTFHEGRRLAMKYASAGLFWAPYAIDGETFWKARTECHDGMAHRLANEK
jgi:hypothetical protein